MYVLSFASAFMVGQSRIRSTLHEFKLDKDTMLISGGQQRSAPRILSLLLIL